MGIAAIARAGFHVSWLLHAASVQCSRKLQCFLVTPGVCSVTRESCCAPLLSGIRLAAGFSIAQHYRASDMRRCCPCQVAGNNVHLPSQDGRRCCKRCACWCCVCIYVWVCWMSLGSVKPGAHFRRFQPVAILWVCTCGAISIYL